MVFIEDVLSKTREHMRKLYHEWFRDFPIDKRPLMMFMIAGYPSDRSKETKGKIYLLNSHLDYAPMLFAKGICMMGIPQYATYLANRYYDPNMRRESAAALGEFLISETATQDPKVGGPINIAAICPKEGYRELSRDEIARIHERNEQQGSKLKESFFRR